MEDNNEINLKGGNVPAAARMYVDTAPESAEEFGKWLKQLRKEKGLTLVQLSELIGYSQPHLSQVENAKHGKYPHHKFLEKVAPHLDIEYAQLLRAAGYNDLAEKVEYKQLLEDFGGLDFRFSKKEIEQLKNDNTLWKHVTDLQAFLKENYVSDSNGEKVTVKPFYNGHELTDDQREKIRSVIETIFPELK